MLPARIQTVTVWINAFVPRHIPEYTVALDSGLHAGETAFASRAGSWFLTDQRGFSDSRGALSLLHSEAQIDFSRGPLPRLTQSHHFVIASLGEDPSRQARRLVCDSHAWYRLFKPGTSVPGPPMATPSFLMRKRRGPGADLVQVQLGSGNQQRAEFENEPLRAVDYRGTLVMDLLTRQLAFEGHVDYFPAFEMYAAINDERPQPLFRLSPAPGKTVDDLSGKALRLIRGAITFV